MYLLFKGPSLKTSLHCGRLLYCRYILYTQSVIGQHGLGSEINDTFERNSPYFTLDVFVVVVVSGLLSLFASLFVCLFLFVCFASLFSFYRFFYFLISFSFLFFFVSVFSCDDTSAKIVREKSRKTLFEAQVLNNQNEL